MRCSRCGAKSPEDFSFCVECGDPLVGSEAGEALEASRPAGPIPAAPTESVGSASGSGQARPGSGRLRVERGPVDGREFELDKPVVVIGRRLGNEVVIHGSNVSRRHARILSQDGGFAIEDTNSAQGTIVNDERIDALRPLHHGDVVKIGDAVFVFETDSVGGAGSGTPDADAAVAEPDRPPAAPGPAADGIDAVHAALAALNRDLATSRADLGGLVGRIERLKRALDQVSAELQPRLQAVRPLRGLVDALSDLEAAAGSEGVQAASEVLEHLADRPRDAELLVELSRQLAALHDLLHLHRRLAPAVPEIREAIRRIVA